MLTALLMLACGESFPNDCCSSEPVQGPSARPGGQGGHDSDSGLDGAGSAPHFLTHVLDRDARVVNGWEYHSGNGLGIGHHATDFEAAIGTALHAPCDGVAMASSQYADGWGFGTFIQVRCDQLSPDGQHYHVLLAHVSEVESTVRSYAQDDRANTDYDAWTPVTRGQRIGASGMEDTVWPHVHVQVMLGRYSGTPVDPFDLYARTRSSSDSSEMYYPPSGSRFEGCGPDMLWTTCPLTPASGVGCEGSLTRLEVSDGELHIEAKAHCDAAIEKLSVVVGQDQVVEQWPNDTDAEVDERVPVPDGDHSVGLWVRSAGQSVLLASGQLSVGEPCDGCTTAVDETNAPTRAGSSARDVFVIESVSIDQNSGDPRVTLSLAKDDGGDMKSSKSCQVRVGSRESYGQVRTETEVKAGSRSWTVTFSAWPEGGFLDAPCSETKDFWWTCDDGSQEAWWYAGEPALVRKSCD